MIGEFLCALYVVKHYDRANADLGLVDLGFVDYLRVCDHLAQLVDPRVDLALLLLCLIVLAVLGEVAECTRGGYLLLVLLDSYVYEIVELLL